MATITANEDGIVMGDDGRNILQGDSGDNYLDGLGGRDWVFGHGGNDILIFDNADQMLNGGEGFDTLRFLAGHQIASLISKPVIQNVEAIDFASQDNLLTLTATSIADVSDNDALVITGGHNNRVDPGNGWQYEGFSSGGRFYEFSQGGVRMHTETSVQVTGFNQSTELALSDSADSWQGSFGQSPGHADYVHGNGGDDYLVSYSPFAQLFGDDGNDQLISAFYGSVLHGGDGDDRLEAEDSAVMYGDAGDDQIFLIEGGSRITYGGDGADTFSIGDYATGMYSILDFNGGEGDSLQISAPSGAFSSAEDLQFRLVDSQSHLYELGYLDTSSAWHNIVTIGGTDFDPDSPLSVELRFF